MRSIFKRPDPPASRRRRAGTLFILSALVLASAAGARAQQAGGATAARAEAELPNFHQVNASLYRGAQPRPGGLRKLAAMGVKTVINLRAEDEHAQEEEREARSLGLRYFAIPMRREGRPTREQLERALALIGSADNQPVFVHCKRGADRTGTVVAVYRITHDGWTAEQALDEAKHYGMGWWQVKKKDFIKDFYRDRGQKSR